MITTDKVSEMVMSKKKQSTTNKEVDYLTIWVRL